MKRAVGKDASATLHTGPEGAAVARSWKAKAVAIGPNIYASRVPNPGVLAHEVAHVRQWREGRTASADRTAVRVKARPWDPLEQEVRSGQPGSARSSANVFGWDDPDDGLVRPGPVELAQALGRIYIRDSATRMGREPAFRVLQANTGHLRRLRREYDETHNNHFFHDLDRQFTGDGWGRVLPIVEGALTLAEQIHAHTQASTDEEGIYRLLRRVPPSVARQIVEEGGGRSPAEHGEHFTSLDGALREALQGLWQDPNEYHRARAILLDRAGLAPAAEPSEVDHLAQARQDHAYERIHSGFERYSFWSGQTPLASQALLAAAELSHTDRQAVLVRVRHNLTRWGLADIDAYNELVSVLSASTDADALRYAMSVSIRRDGNDVDPLGMERALERSATLVAQAASDPAELARVQRHLHNPLLMERLASQPGWRDRMRRLRVPPEARIGFEITQAESTAQLIDRLAAFGPMEISGALQANPELRRQLRAVQVTGGEQEALAAMTQQTCVVLREGQATQVAQLAAWQLLQAARGEDRARVIAILRTLPAIDRATLRHSQSFREFESVLQNGSLMDQAFLGQAGHVIDGDLEPHRLGWIFGHDRNPFDIYDVGRVEDASVFAEGLAGSYADEHDAMRQALVDFQLPRAEWSSLPSDREQKVREYALRRELIHRSADGDETMLNDVMFGEPRLMATPGNPLNPGMEAEYMHARVLDRADVRASFTVLNDWSRTALDEATVRFLRRFDAVRLGGGVTQAELAGLYPLYRAAMQQTSEHRESSDQAASMMASVVGAAVGVAVIVASGGTATPAVAALAGTLGGGAAAGVGYGLRAESTGASIATDFGTGFIEGSLAVALEPLLAGSLLVRGAGSLTARGAGSLGASAVTRVAVGRGASGLVQSVIEGALSGAAGELYMTATDRATWNGSITEVFARLISAMGRGAGMGALGGAVGFGLMGGAGAIWRRVASSHGDTAVREVLGAMDAIALGSGEQLARLSEEQVEALMRARRMTMLGDEASAAELLRAHSVIPTGQVDELIAALTTRREAAVRAAMEMGQTIDHPRLATELNLPPGNVLIDPGVPAGGVQLRYRAGLDGVSRLRLHVSPTASMGDALAHAPTADALRAWARETRGAWGMLERAQAAARGGMLSNADEVVLEVQKHARMIEAREHLLSGAVPSERTAQRLQDEIAALRRAGHDLRVRLEAQGVPSGMIASGETPGLTPIRLDEMPSGVRAGILDSPAPHRASSWRGPSRASDIVEGYYIYIIRNIGTEQILKVGRTSHLAGSEAMGARMRLYRRAQRETGFDVQVEMHRVQIDTAPGAPTALSQTHSFETQLRDHLYQPDSPTRGFQWDNEVAHNAGRFGPGTPTEPVTGRETVTVYEFDGARIRLSPDGAPEARWVPVDQPRRLRMAGRTAPFEERMPRRLLYDWRRMPDDTLQLQPVGRRAGTALPDGRSGRWSAMTTQLQRETLEDLMDGIIAANPDFAQGELVSEMATRLSRGERTVYQRLQDAGLTPTDYLSRRASQ